MIRFLPAIGLSFSVSVMLYHVLRAFFSRNDFIGRIDPFIGKVKEKAGEKPKKAEAYRHGIGFLARGLERTGFLSHYNERVRIKMVRANLMMKPEEYISIRMVVAASSGVVGMIVLGSLPALLAAAVIGWIIPGIVLNRNCAKRLKAINNQLGDTIAILSNALKAGHSFFQAVDSVIREIRGPVSEEFSKLQKEISLGVATEKALENMVERVGSDDLELMVTAVLIQRQIGGNLAEILDSISGTIRQRIRAKGEIRAITAQGRMSGWIISLLPVFLALIVSVISPAQIKTLVTHPLGIIMIFIAIVMEAIGIFIVKRMINIEV